MLMRVALSMNSQPADAQDLVQDTLLRAWRSLDTFDGNHPRAWLLTILRNADHNRRRKAVPIPADPHSPELLYRSQAADSAESATLQSHLDADIEAALHQLKPEVRELILLIDGHGLSYAEAAAVMGLPVGTVMSRLHRGRTRIRKQLGNKPLGEGGEYR